MTDDDVLNSPVLPLLLELEAAGVRFRLDGDLVLVSPSGALTPEQREVIRMHKASARVLVAMGTDQGVHERRDAFRQQYVAAPPLTVPGFLFRPGVPYLRGVCFSCGDLLSKLRFGRCWRCSLAWRLACRLPIPSALATAIDETRQAA